MNSDYCMGMELLRDDGAVSPVVGVALLLAITVVLAATTAAFAFEFGDRADNRPPQTDFTYEYSQAGNGELVITHEAGDTLDPSTIRVQTSNGQFHPAPGNTSSLSGTAVSELGLDSQADGTAWVGSDVEAGAEFGIVGESTNSLETATVRIVWVDPSGGRTVVLGEWQGPDA